MSSFTLFLEFRGFTTHLEAFIFIITRCDRGWTSIDAASRKKAERCCVVSNVADLDRLYDTVRRQKGPIDILFANPGVIEVAPLGSITEAHFDKIFSINVKGLLFTVQKALFQDGGSIILLPSEVPKGLRCDQGSYTIICTFLDCRSEKA